MRARAAVAMLGLVLAGCAGSPIIIGSLEASGALRAAPSQSQDFDWLVSLRNDKGVLGDYNPDVKEIRHDTVVRYISRRCVTPAIVGEKMTETSSGLFGPTRLYEIQVKCGASKPA